MKPKQPKITERDITRQIRGYLKMKVPCHWKQWQGLGSTPGVPDVVGCYRGRFIGIEIKTPQGRMSPHQEKWRQLIEEAGGIYIMARSFEDVIAYFEGNKQGGKP